MYRRQRRKRESTISHRTDVNGEDRISETLFRRITHGKPTGRIACVRRNGSVGDLRWFRFPIHRLIVRNSADQAARQQKQFQAASGFAHSEQIGATTVLNGGVGNRQAGAFGSPRKSKCLGIDCGAIVCVGCAAEQILCCRNLSSGFVRIKIRHYFTSKTSTSPTPVPPSAPLIIALYAPGGKVMRIADSWEQPRGDAD